MPHPLSHTIEIRVRFGETDPYGVAYFAAILDYFKRGMDEFLRSRGLSPGLAYRNRKRHYGFPVVSTHCRYRSPVRFDDLLTLRTRIVRVEKGGATFGFSLYRTEAGKETLAAEGRVSCRSIDASWTPIPLPAELKNHLIPPPRRTRRPASSGVG
ncbi:MAG: acyl-CoA thioesterase [Deltaproteobacteria bacterium]|nr:acyl-CoA thioesterase [Deltaproteobacteria bacterium]